MSRNPYKFLDYYTFEDADIFFGREEETRKMVGEILSTRLLVLFSPSGSGKTSLIEAGVRPQLEEMGYKTVYSRMEDDPVVSVRRAVREALGETFDEEETQEAQENLEGVRDEDDGFYDYFKTAAESAGRPLVIFLDQFEEFFIYHRDNPEVRRRFIRETAKVKYDDDLPVFLVLSLREDYFAGLHEFREEIPSIFQHNANIRLEPLAEKAARRAVEGPVKTMGFDYEPELADRLLEDLKCSGGGIAPIKLQLVCSSLWEMRNGERNLLTEASYDSCGGVEGIVGGFIAGRLDRVPRRRQSSMARLLEALKTPDNTKRLRSFEDLRGLVKTGKPGALEELLQTLSEAGILREEERGGTRWFEYKHDYLVGEVVLWLKKRKERLARRRFLYAVLPGLVLFLTLFTYFFIQYHTFYASFSDKAYDYQIEEIVIERGFNPFDLRITTGFFKEDLKDQDAKNRIKNKLKFSFWNINDWSKFSDQLNEVKRVELLFKKENQTRGIKTLLRALQGDIPTVRSSAASVLGTLGKADKMVLEALIHAIKQDNDYKVRSYAASSLGTLGKDNKMALEALIDALKEDKEDYVRSSAASALGTLGKADNMVLEALIDALKEDKEDYVRSSAASSLGTLGKADSKAMAALIHALKKDKDRYVRSSAADALGTLGKADNKAMEALIHALKKDKYLYVRSSAASSLGTLGKADSKAMAALIHALKKDKDRYVRSSAADALGTLGKADNKAMEALIHALKEDKVDFVRIAAASSLGALGKADDKAMEALIHALKHANDSNVRSFAASTLGKLGKDNKMVLEALIHALKEDKADFMRSSAADALGALGKPDKDVLEALIHALKEDKEGFVRRSAADALGTLGKADSKAMEALIHALKDQNEDVRSSAAHALGKLSKNKPVKDLINYLKHPLSEYRTIGAFGLFHKQKNSPLAPETIEEIRKILNTEKAPWIRLGAWNALILLSGGKYEVP
jgi:HEAT repeat protein